MDMKSAFPHAVEGQVLRAGTYAVAGITEMIDPPLRYVPDSNAAAFQCSGTTLTMKCNFVSLAPINPSVLPQVQKVCIINHAGFVMKYDVDDKQTKSNVGKTGNYPINQEKCIDLSSSNGVKDGDVMHV